MLVCRLTASAVVLSVAASPAAMANPEKLTLQQAAEKLAALQAEVDALRADLAKFRQQAAANAVSAPSQAAAPVSSPTPATPAPPVSLSWKGAPEFSGDGWSFKPRGRLIFDAAHVSAPDGVRNDGLGFSNEARQARLGVQGTVPGGIGYRFELDFATGGSEIADAYITLPVGPAQVTVGQHKNFQSLEELTSNPHLSFIERAAFTDAFGFERRLGVSATVQQGSVVAQAGVFTDQIADLSNDANNSYSLDGRLVYMPKIGDTQWHVAVSAHRRDLNDSAGTTRYRQRPAVHSSDTRFLATPALPVTCETSAGIEAAVIAGPFYAAAEAHWLRAALPAAANPTFFGGYVEGGYFFTGEHRGYKAGTFDRVKVRSPLSTGGIGAISLNVRYDHLDLSDSAIIGGTQNGLQAALNWKPSDYVFFGLNAAYLDYDDAALPKPDGDRDYGVGVIALRSQIDF